MSSDTAVPLVRPTLVAAPRVLDDIEMVLRGAYAPLRGFPSSADLAAVRLRGELADGTPFPVALTLSVDPELGEVAARVGALDVLDEEGTPVATVVVSESWATEDAVGIAGDVIGLRALERGSHRGLRRDACSMPDPGSTTTIGVPLRRALRTDEVTALVAEAEALGARVRLLPLTGHGSPTGVDAITLVGLCLRTRDELARQGVPADLVPVALPRHEDAAPDAERALAAVVARAYGATTVSGPLGESRVASVADDAADCVDEAAAHSLARTAVLFSGLSGSGKSTLANAVRDALVDRDERPVTLLDGDVVRRMLSAELSFSREHRELNVRRIGFVAAEIVRHGGVALCAPIAPYAAGRAEIRAMVTAAGGRFVLVHVSTPLEVCEGRDRKGLYAKARRGEIPAFTGVSDPYETPVDADLVVDTSVVSLDAAVALVLDVL